MIQGSKKKFVATLDAAIADLKNGYAYSDVFVLRQAIKTAITEGLVGGEYLDKAPVPYGLADNVLTGSYSSSGYAKYGFVSADGNLYTSDYLGFIHDKTFVDNGNVIETFGTRYDAFQLAKARYLASPFYGEAVNQPTVTDMPVAPVQATHVVPLPNSTIGLLYSPSTNQQTGTVVADTETPAKTSFSGTVTVGTATLALAPTSCAAMGGEPWMVMIGFVIVCSIMVTNRIRHGR